MQQEQRLSTEELAVRMNRFRIKMDQTYQGWQMAVITSDVNLYYFTGTIQRGALIIQREGKSIFWVRKSYERALLESNFQLIYPMVSFRDAMKEYGELPNTVYLEKNQVSLSWYEMFDKYFRFSSAVGIDRLIQAVRSVKTDYEIALQMESGKKHRILAEEKIPSLLREGISEAELIGEIFDEAIKLGYQGLSRFSGINGEMSLGYVAFSESGLHPTSFDGPGGTAGISFATPYLGRTDRRLKKGDIILVDFGFGYRGYSTDKTALYSFGGKPDRIVTETFEMCSDLMWKTAEMMRPGRTPSEIYETAMSSVSPSFREGLMGYKDQTVKFLGHGIGLHIDEYPVIANGFDEPLQANTTIALEPKKGLEGYGMIGVEETFLIGENETICLTGKSSAIIEV